MNSKCPIGVFDSGLGGISVLKTLTSVMPKEDFIYLGDSLYNPYGTKTKEEITERCIVICDRFMSMGVKAIVIACNTATSACVPLLRKRYPDIDIIGMEPALKVAADFGSHQRIAVWATELTLKEKKFACLMDRFKDEHQIIKVACPDLVREVEEDRLEDLVLVKNTLEKYLSLSKDVDSIVLGCTHFVFYKSMLSTLTDACLVDGNLGTAIHTLDLLRKRDLLNDSGGSITWLNTLEAKIDLSKRLFGLLEG